MACFFKSHFGETSRIFWLLVCVLSYKTSFFVPKLGIIIFVRKVQRRCIGPTYTKTNSMIIVCLSYKVKSPWLKSDNSKHICQFKSIYNLPVHVFTYLFDCIAWYIYYIHYTLQPFPHIMDAHYTVMYQHGIYAYLHILLHLFTLWHKMEWSLRSGKEFRFEYFVAFLTFS